jgi:cytoskeletal protein RodZ
MAAQTLKAPSRGMQYSVLLHSLLFAALLFGLPHLRHPVEENLSTQQWVDLVSPDAVTKPVQQQSPSDHRHRETKNTGRTQTSRRTDTRPAAPIHPIAKPVLRTPTDPQEQNSPLNNISPTPVSTPNNSASTTLPVTATTQTDTPATDTSRAPVRTNTIDSRLTMGEEDAIRDQVRQFWNAPVGAKDAQDLIITLHVQLGQDGLVMKVELAKDADRYASDSFFRAAADAAIRAVKRSSPFKGLQPGRYSAWGDMEYNFRPSEM